MSNTISMPFDVEEIADALTAQGIEIGAAIYSDDPSVEDDAVHVTDKISVQVGETYLSVTINNGNGTFTLSPPTADVDDIVSTIKARFAEDEFNERTKMLKFIIELHATERNDIDQVKAHEYHVREEGGNKRTIVVPVVTNFTDLDPEENGIKTGTLFIEIADDIVEDHYCNWD